jgi:hypothetical protein
VDETGERDYVTPGCSVCQHPKREDIDHALALAGKSPRYVSECVPLSRAQIRKHWEKCELHPRVRKELFRKMCAEVSRGKFTPEERAS